MIARCHRHYLEACLFPRDTSRYLVVPIALTDVVFAGSSVHRDNKRDQYSHQCVRLKQSRRIKFRISRTTLRPKDLVLLQFFLMNVKTT